MNRNKYIWHRAISLPIASIILQFIFCLLNGSLAELICVKNLILTAMVSLLLLGIGYIAGGMLYKKEQTKKEEIFENNNEKST